MVFSRFELDLSIVIFFFNSTNSVNYVGNVTIVASSDDELIYVNRLLRWFRLWKEASPAPFSACLKSNLRLQGFVTTYAYKSELS